MRTFVRAMIVGITIVGAMNAAAFAGEIRKSSVFKEPRLGLGADIPDALLFEEGADERSGGHTLTVGKKRTVRTKPGARAPILDGWEAGGNQLASRSGWRAGEPVRAGCLASDVIMAGLLQAGWSEFDRFSMRPRTMAFNARRRDGRAKRVQVDRCTGEIIHVSASYSQ